MRNVLFLQCLLFYKEDKTLAGNKIKVYVVTKILRKCTNTDITSFKVSKDKSSQSIIVKLRSWSRPMVLVKFKIHGQKRTRADDIIQMLQSSWALNMGDNFFRKS